MTCFRIFLCLGSKCRKFVYDENEAIALIIKLSHSFGNNCWKIQDEQMEK